MKTSFPPVPSDIRSCQHFMKLAEDHDDRNIVISYYSRMAAIQLAMKMLPGPKPPEVGKFLVEIMEWLETTKRDYASVEGIGNETIAQALIEEYLLRLYNFAYGCDTRGEFNKNMVKAYYTASLLCDVLTQFGELSEDLTNKCDTAKYRAAYIHNMLKKGQEPSPINVTVVKTVEEENEFTTTREEINKQRILRGEEPLPDEDDELEEPPKEKPEYPPPPVINNFADYVPTEEPQLPPADNIFDLPSVPSSTPSLPPKPQSPPEPKPRAQVPPSASNSSLYTSTSIAELRPDQSEKAMKYCKWASSALNYDDIKTAIDNLEKALYLCKFGKEKE